MDQQVEYLLSLRSIRERASIVGDAAKAGKLSHFDFQEGRLDHVADLVISVIERDFGPDRFDEIPPHGRWQHFEVGSVPRLGTSLRAWREAGSDDREVTRCLVDLFFVSVLLDAGAGDHWQYREPGTGHMYERSEGIAVASLHMFNSHAFADGGSRAAAPMVTGKGLQDLTADTLKTGFQVADGNPMLGMASRAALLGSLGRSLLSRPSIFGEAGRPGNLVDYMVTSAGTSSELDVLVLWDVLQDLLIPVWPAGRTTIGGTPLGDAWPLGALRNQAAPDATAAHIQPFHKLTQWLTYSLMVPFERILSFRWVHADSLTALAEYRNGGLFVDLGVLSLKQEALERGRTASGSDLPLFDPGDDVIVEWRAMTLVLIDALYSRVLARMGGRVQLSMAQLLEAGTWKSGREVAARNRPHTKSSPILIKSDGTLF